MINAEKISLKCRKYVRGCAKWVLAISMTGIISCADLVQQPLNDRNLIVGIEGLQPWSGASVHNMVSNFADEFGLCACASSGDWSAHILILQEANSKGKYVFLVGYSSGCNEVRALAETGKVTILFFIDPTYTGNAFVPKIPGTVDKVITCTGKNSGILGGKGRITPDMLENPQHTIIENYTIKGADHLDMPTDPEVNEIFKKGIRTVSTK